MSDTSIRVSDELADELYARKGRSTSYEEFIWELLAAVDGPIEESVDERDTVDRIESALSGWEPDTDANAQASIEETARVGAWLETTRERHKRSEIVEACVPSDINEEHWWTAKVRPGLQQLAELGLVEYRPNYPDYQWSG